MYPNQSTGRSLVPSFVNLYIPLVIEVCQFSFLNEHQILPLCYPNCTCVSSALSISHSDKDEASSFADPPPHVLILNLIVVLSLSKPLWNVHFMPSTVLMVGGYNRKLDRAYHLVEERNKQTNKRQIYWSGKVICYII